jgi:hypothetical protein
LNGWEPREFHEYVYEDDRLVGAVVTRESEWSPDDVALALAHMRNEADRGAHGIPMSEAMDVANQFAFVGPDAPLTDWAEKALSEAKDRYYAAYPNAKRHGHIWRVKRRT